MSRGRKKIEVDREELQKAITQVEATQELTNRTALWNAVAQTEYAKNISLSPQTAMLRAEQFQLNISTPKGLRGRAPGSGPVPRRPKSQRVSLEVVTLQKKNFFDESLHPIVDKAASGSMKAAIKLKCIDCCAGSKLEVALCTITTCPLWGFRPYKRVPRESVR